MLLRKVFYGTMVFMILGSFLGMTLSIGAEHPAEHPKGEGGLTKDDLADAIVEYINEQAAENDGYFIVIDDATGEELKLTLDKVHRERLARVDVDTYFACTDFMSNTGKMYDLDVFMTGTTAENLEFSKFSVHKVDGKPRYTWYNEDGVWKKKYAGDKEF